MVTQISMRSLTQQATCRYIRCYGISYAYYDPNIYLLDTLPSVCYMGVEYGGEEYTQIGCAFGVPVRDDHSPSKQWCCDALLEDLDWAQE